MGENCDHEHESASPGEKVIQDAMSEVRAGSPDSWPTSPQADQLNAWCQTEINKLVTRTLNICCAAEVDNTEAYDAHSKLLLAILTGYTRMEAMTVMHALCFTLAAAMKAADMGPDGTYLDYAKFVKQETEASDHPLAQLAKMKEPEND